MKKISNAAVIVSSVALIVGNLIGAGILGLPINTGLAGMWPSMLAMLAGGAIMCLTAVILGDHAAASRTETFDYPSFYRVYLGNIGKWIAIAANLVILYGLLTAYFTGGATILDNLAGDRVSQKMALLILAGPLILVTCLNIGFLQKLNVYFILTLICAFGVMIAIGLGGVSAGRMRYTDWSFLPSTLPIIVTAFHFHNVIPLLSANLNWDRSKFRKSVFLGMIIAFILNGLWVMTAIGVIPLTGANGILNSWETNIPATVPMAAILNSGTFTLCAGVFAMLAISTSFLANGLGLQNFIRDLLVNTFKINSRPLVCVLTFLPPLVIALVYPDIFLKALDVVGGVGIVTLFCILPTLIVIMDKTRSRAFRLVCLAAFVASLFVLGMEIMQECGLLKLKPWIEYHQVDF